MAKDDIFKIIYVILKELHEHRKDGTRTPIDDIGPERFGITDGYWISIICDLVDEGYIKGVTYRAAKTRTVISGAEDIAITLKGEEYLRNNSVMKQVFNALKDIKDIAPGI